MPNRGRTMRVEVLGTLRGEAAGVSVLPSASKPRQILALLQSGVGRFTDGEPVDEHDHAMQCAAMAVADGADTELVVAAALHDIGYHPLVAARFPELPHELSGARFATELFGALRARMADRIRTLFQGLPCVRRGMAHLGFTPAGVEGAASPGRTLGAAG